MGWSIGFDEDWKRDVGYGVPATCDHPDCGAEIDRGLAYVCGNNPYGGEDGCGLYFCAQHQHGPRQLCERCTKRESPFEPTPDVAEWNHHKLTDETWAKWRELNPEQVAKLKESRPDIPGLKELNDELELQAAFDLTDVTIIGENDHGYRFAVGKRGHEWQALAIGKTEDETIGFFFPNLCENRFFRDDPRETAILFAGAFAQDPENMYGGISRWFVPENLRGKPEDFRCPDCGSYDCDEH